MATKPPTSYIRIMNEMIELNPIFQEIPRMDYTNMFRILLDSMTKSVFCSHTIGSSSKNGFLLFPYVVPWHMMTYDMGDPFQMAYLQLQMLLLSTCLLLFITMTMFVISGNINHLVDKMVFEWLKINISKLDILILITNVYSHPQIDGKVNPY